MSGKIRKEVLWRDRKRFCQLYDILQSHVPLSSLYPTYIVPMQFRAFGQFLLRVPSFVAQLPQRGAESRLDGACSHTPILEF